MWVLTCSFITHSLVSQDLLVAREEEEERATRMRLLTLEHEKQARPWSSAQSSAACQGCSRCQWQRAVGCQGRELLSPTLCGCDDPFLVCNRQQKRRLAEVPRRLGSLVRKQSEQRSARWVLLAQAVVFRVVHPCRWLAHRLLTHCMLCGALADFVSRAYTCANPTIAQLAISLYAGT